MQGSRRLGTCGFCSMLSGLLRRAVCIGSRRGSSESFYRELGNQDTVKIEERSSDLSSNSSDDAANISPDSYRNGEGEPVSKKYGPTRGERAEDRHSDRDSPGAAACPLRVNKKRKTQSTSEEEPILCPKTAIEISEGSTVHQSPQLSDDAVLEGDEVNRQVASVEGMKTECKRETAPCTKEITGVRSKGETASTTEIASGISANLEICIPSKFHADGVLEEEKSPTLVVKTICNPKDETTLYSKVASKSAISLPTKEITGGSLKREKTAPPEPGTTSSSKGDTISPPKKSTGAIPKRVTSIPLKPPRISAPKSESAPATEEAIIATVEEETVFTVQKSTGAIPKKEPTFLPQAATVPTPKGRPDLVSKLPTASVSKRETGSHQKVIKTSSSKGKLASPRKLVTVSTPKDETDIHSEVATISTYEEETLPSLKKPTGAIPKEVKSASLKKPTGAIPKGDTGIIRKREAPPLPPRRAISKPTPEIPPKPAVTIPEEKVGLIPKHSGAIPRRKTTLPPKTVEETTATVSDSATAASSKETTIEKEGEAAEKTAADDTPKKDAKKTTTSKQKRAPDDPIFVYIGCCSDVVLLDPKKREEHFMGYLTIRKRRRKSQELSSIRREQLLTEYLSRSVSDYLHRNAGEWKFNAFYFDKLAGGRGLPALCLHLFEEHGLMEHFNLDIVKCWKLFTLFESGYHSTNPYHNSIHATDVTQAMHCFLLQGSIRAFIRPVEIIACLLSAIAHDIFHPGVNQGFLIATCNHLADLYRNFSVLESHHWRAALSCIIESGLLEERPDLQEELKIHLKVLIMATDITRQHDYLSRFKKLLDTNTLDMRIQEHRILVLQIALKCADISNPCRPWSVSQKWSVKVCEEFFRQGDYEKMLDLPVTQLCDRDSTSIPKIQTGFFKFIVTPLITEWNRFLDSKLSSEMRANLNYNEVQWELLMTEEVGRETRLTINEMERRVETLKPLSDTSYKIHLTVYPRRASADPAGSDAATVLEQMQKSPVTVTEESGRGLTEDDRQAIARALPADGSSVTQRSELSDQDATPTTPVFLKCSLKVTKGKQKEAIRSDDDMLPSRETQSQRRGSAPAPICPTELRGGPSRARDAGSRRRASPVGTCQQWLARAMPRRSSLPVEVYPLDEVGPSK
uniref:Phosphodiesterase n=1 Tax=Bombyx mori TaxID=7091 RepID=A0A8R2DQI0_BOMMO|nr:uncharacterized protein LOC101739482 isoform X3 [Bombyx mori]